MIPEKYTVEATGMCLRAEVALKQAVNLMVSACIGIAIASPCMMGSESETFSQPPAIAALVQTNCYDCHDIDVQKGGVRLDNLSQLNQGARLDLLNKVQEQVYTNQMPPKEKMPSKESESLLAWVSSELTRHKASKLEDKLRYYKYANYINHEKLFDGSITDMPYTPARRWKVSKYIYLQLCYEVLGIEKRKTGRVAQYTTEAPRSLRGLIQPFSLPSDSGVKYYDTDSVETGELLMLMDNARYMVDRQLIFAKTKGGYVEQKISTGYRGGSVFRPKSTDREFEKIILSKDPISESDLQAAITRQFQVALQRKPSSDEIAQYLSFMKKIIQNGNSTSALERMMTLVLMEPEFIYRSEFGDGQPDAYGRTKLTPREASYALAYALTDRIPDQALVDAANSGKLSTKEDYRREVLRMLNDDSVNKPRIMRFSKTSLGTMEYLESLKTTSDSAAPTIRAAHQLTPSSGTPRER